MVLPGTEQEAISSQTFSMASCGIPQVMLASSGV